MRAVAVAPRDAVVSSDSHMTGPVKELKLSYHNNQEAILFRMMHPYYPGAPSILIPTLGPNFGLLGAPRL